MNSKKNDGCFQVQHIGISLEIHMEIKNIFGEVNRLSCDWVLSWIVIRMMSLQHL